MGMTELRQKIISFLFDPVQKIYENDEFSSFPGNQVVNLINQGRSAGVHAVLATQSLSDIQIKGGIHCSVIDLQCILNVGCKEIIIHS